MIKNSNKYKPSIENFVEVKKTTNGFQFKPLNGLNEHYSDEEFEKHCASIVWEEHLRIVSETDY